jgi:hypothetical protein
VIDSLASIRLGSGPVTTNSLGCSIRRPRGSVAPRRMETIARQLLDASKLCAIATTVSPRELARINSA